MSVTVERERERERERDGLPKSGGDSSEVPTG